MRFTFLLSVVGCLILSLVGVSTANAKEFCFGAVGKQCATPDKVKGKKPSPLNIPACSKIEKGKTNCWVSPGSIAHDNCCALHSKGMYCSNESTHDGHCAKEWEAALKDIKSRLAWHHVFDAKKSASLNLVSSPRMKKFGGKETQATADLCALGGAKFLASHGQTFCCAGKAKPGKGPKGESVLICAQESQKALAKKGGMDLKNVLKQIDDLTKQLASLQGGEKKAVEQKIAHLKKETKSLEAKEKFAATSPPILPVLPKASPPQIVKKPSEPKPAPQPIASRPKQEEPVTPPLTEPEYKEEEVYPLPPPEEPVATTPQPVPEEPEQETTPQCDRGTWSPTFRRCIEEEVQEEVAPPDCGASMHWSPTLRSCQPD